MLPERCATHCCLVIQCMLVIVFCVVFWYSMVHSTAWIVCGVCVFLCFFSSCLQATAATALSSAAVLAMVSWVGMMDGRSGQ